MRRKPHEDVQRSVLGVEVLQILVTIHLSVSESRALPDFMNDPTMLTSTVGTATIALQV